jgi:anti-sigma B factor antagonist
MEINIRQKNDFTVVELIGNFDTRTAIDVQSELTALIEKGNKRLVINMETVEYISSSGLRVLLYTAKQLIAATGELRLCCLNDTVQEVFSISGFNTILNVYGTEAEALTG